jgi:hypothetical protein
MKSCDMLDMKTMIIPCNNIVYIWICFKIFLIIQTIKCLDLTETGVLFSLGIQLMQLFSENQADFTKLTGILGLYYQISNDYRNLCRQEVCIWVIGSRYLNLSVCLSIKQCRCMGCWWEALHFVVLKDEGSVKMSLTRL